MRRRQTVAGMVAPTARYAADRRVGCARHHRRDVGIGPEHPGLVGSGTQSLGDLAVGVHLGQRQHRCRAA
ncbi:MAG: hypothetical protein V9G15_00180 [Dermatophilaceae bacterium]